MVRFGLSGLAVLVLCCYAWWATPRIPILDDSFIALSSARAALRGHDPSFGMPALTGATSPAYVAVLAALLQIGLEPLAALRAAAAFSGAAFVLALWCLARAGGLSLHSSFPWLILIAGSGQTWMSATNGLETGLALALVTAVIAAALTGRNTLVALGVGLLPWLRPDLALVGGAVLLWCMWPQDWPARIRLAGLAVLACTPFAIWVRLDTGAWTAQTMLAKYAFFAEVCWPLDRKLVTTRDVLALWGMTVAPASIGLLFVWRYRLGAVALIAVALTLCGYAWFFPRGLSHNSLRYVFPLLLPWAAVGWIRVLQRWPREGAVGIGVLALLTLLFRQPQHELHAFFADEMVSVSNWLETNLPTGSKLLVHDVGGPSVLTSHRLVDIVGLKTPSSIDLHKTITLPSCGERRGDAVVEIARRSEADYLVVIGGWDKPFGFSTALARAGMLGKAVRTPPESWPNGYTVYRINRVSDGAAGASSATAYSPAASGAK